MANGKRNHGTMFITTSLCSQPYRDGSFGGIMSIFLNGRSLSCLVCPKSSASCGDQRHPLQRVLSYDELIAKHARKINRDQHDSIGIYTCPYCSLDRLTIDALYEHSRDVHPPSITTNEPPTETRPIEVHCPVCVCFRLENWCDFVPEAGGGLAGHMLRRHCFASSHQYSDEFKLRHDFCCDDEFEMIRFLATFLPPAIITSPASLEDARLSALKLEQQSQQPSVCCICLEEIPTRECKDLPMCHHQFHGPCIDRWLVERNCCPICRCECSS